MATLLSALLIEEPRDDSNPVHDILRSSGFDPIVQRVNPQQELSHGPWDVVFCDCELLKCKPAMDAVRRHDPDVPVIALIGQVGEESAAALMRAGANDVVLKRTPARLGPAVQRELREAENRRIRRQVEREVRRLAAIVRSSDDAIIGKTLDGLITDWNEGAERLYGYTADEMIGQPIQRLIPPERSDDYGRLMARIRAGERVDHFETIRLRKDGSRVDVSISISPVTDESGRVIGASKIARDITEQKRAAETIRRNEARFRALVEHSWDGVTLIDAAGTIRYATPATTRVLGYPLDEYLGHNGLEFVYPEDQAAMIQVLQKVVAEPGSTDRCSYRYRHKNGSWRCVETTITNMLDDPHVSALVLNSRDITETRAAVDALRASEAQLRSVVETIPEILWVSDADGQIIYTNARWREYLGDQPEEPLGVGWYRSVHPDDFEAARSRWLQAIKSGGAYESEHRLRRADGVFRWHLVRGRPVRDAAGRILRWYGTCTDIDDRRRAEADRGRDAQILASVRDSVIVTDADGLVTYWNDGATRIFGFTHDEMIGKRYWDRFPDAESREFVRNNMAKMAAGEEWIGEWLDYRKDGSRVWIDSRTGPLRDSAGRIVGILGVAHDVSARKQAEEAVRAAEQRLRHVLASSPAVLFTLAFTANRISGISWVSDNIQEMLGFTVEEALAPNWWLENIHPDDHEKVVESTHLHLLSRDQETHEYRFRRKDGRYIWTRGEMRLIREADGRPLEIVGSWTDVNEHRQLEEQFRQAQKMEAIGVLAGGVAHDFNNLLTIINGYADLLLQRLPEEDPSRELVDEIHKAGERSAGLTRQLLAFSRQQVLAPRILDLNTVVSDTEKLLRRVIGEDVRLVFTPGKDLWPVRADPGQIEQVLLNLAVNARDAMPTGGRLTIETLNIDLDETYVRSHADARPGPHVELSITDTGCGMPPQVQARIFEPFFTTKGPGKGTGLGLATVYGIIKQSGGHLGVYSEVGIGTTMKVYLPRTEKLGSGVTSRTTTQAPPMGTETVLLVEDEEGVRALTRHMLSRCGYTVLEAANGTEAAVLAKSHKRPIHLLITDVVMPGLGGRAVAERIASLHPGIRVLYVSGYTDDAVVRHGVLQEGVSFLQKPFSPLALAHKVREVLDGPPPPH